jgi:cellobiose epimerase
MPSARPSLRTLMITVVILLGAICSHPAEAQSAATPVATPPAPINYVAPSKASYLKFAGETETMLRRDVLGVWFPRTVDHEHGGFYSGFARDWQPTKSQGKFSVFQGRMTWIASQIVMRRPDLKEQYLPIVQHGVDFLNNVLWDKQYGGFFWGVDDNGQITPFYSDGKELYGISFGLYGAAAAYQATHDPKALELAQKTFRWIDEHAHDAKNGGYLEWLTRDGKVVEGNPESVTIQSVPLAHFPIGYKSMNTHIHLLESFTQLYEVWKDDTLRQRLEELLALNRDKICVQPGVMNLYFTNDWRPIPDHDSYGHDVETAYLMLEAEDVLGHGHDPRTEHMAKQLVDHALANGWDETYGGFFQDGTTFGKPDSRLKEWWVQMEGLNSLLLMHEKYGRETDVYFKAFQLQWRFIRDYQIDAQFHGVYQMIGPDGVPTEANKGQIWKAAYHDGRALLNVTDRLQKLAETATQ